MCSKLPQGVAVKFAKYKNSCSLSALGVLIFIFYIFTQRWFELYLQVRTLQVAVIFLALLLIAMGACDKKNLTDKLSNIDYLWFPATAMIVFYILFYGNPKYYLDVFIYSTGFVFLVLAKVNIKVFSASFAFIKCGAVIYALGTIFQYFFTEIFNKFLFNYTVYSSEQLISRLVKDNYYPGLAFGQPATAASYMSTGLGMLFAFWNNKNRNYILFNIALFFILFVGLWMTGKRAIILSTCAALLLTYFAQGIGKEKWKRAIIALVVAIMGFALFSLILHFSDALPLFERMERLGRDLLAGEATGSLLVRMRIYNEAWAIFIENPLFGVGWKQFEVLTSGSYPRDYHVHNVYLQLLCEMGIVGFVIVMVPIIYTYSITYRAINSLLEQSSKINILWKKGLVFSFYFQTFFLIYCLGENPFYHLIIMLIYFFSISIVNSYIVLGKKP